MNGRSYRKTWLFLSIFMTTFVLSEFARAQALPTEFKLSLFLRVPKVASDVTKGLEVVSTASSTTVPVQIYLLAKESDSSNKLCVLAKQTSNVSIVSGSLNLTFAKGVGDQAVSCSTIYCPVGDSGFQIAQQIEGSNAQRKLLRALYTSPLSLEDVEVFTTGALEANPSSPEICEVTSAERFLGVKFQVSNTRGENFPLNFKIKLGAAPYAGIAASVVPGSINTEALANEAITSEKILSISANKLTGNLSWDQLPMPLSTNCADGKVLKRVSDAWACADDLGLGTELDPSVQAFAKNSPGQGLEVVSNQVKLHIDPNHFRFDTGGALSLMDNAINRDKIQAGAVSDDKIDSVSATKIAGVLPVSKGGTGSNATLNNDRVMISSGTKIVESSVTSIELGHLAGVTSGVQEQLNAMAQLSGRAGGQSLRGGTAASENLTLDSTSHTTKGHVIINPSGGNVGIGTTSPDARLSVQGGVATPANIISSGGSVNLSLSSVHVLQSVGGTTITLSNPANGGVYTLIVTDTASRTYTFSGCSFTYFSPSNGATDSGTRTIYGITTVWISSQWHCYISWSSGYQ